MVAKATRGAHLGLPMGSGLPMSRERRSPCISPSKLELSTNNNMACRRGHLFLKASFFSAPAFLASAAGPACSFWPVALWPSFFAFPLCFCVSNPPYTEIGAIKPLAFGQFREMGPGLEVSLTSETRGGRGRDGGPIPHRLIENREAAVGVQMFHLRQR
jgi:hypothetical protein